MSKSKYSPLNPPPYDKATCQKVFGSGKQCSQRAAELYRESPEKYRTVRASAEYWQLVGPSSVATKEEVASLPMFRGSRIYTDYELACLSEYDVLTCEKFYRHSSDGNRDAMIANLTPDQQARLRVAAICHGTIPNTPAAPPKQSTIPTKPLTFKLGADLRKHFNLPDGYEVSTTEYARLVKLKAESDAAKQDAPSTETKAA